MTKHMLVDATHLEEIRVAVIQDQLLLDLEIESSTKEQIKGNIYLGRVTRVEPSLQAAFVDFNGGRQGFLSVNDIHPKYYPPEFTEEPENLPEEDPTGEEGDDVGDEEEGSLLGESRSRFFQRRRSVPIQKILVKGQNLVVQVVKETRGTKGASLTTNISLAGRYTVLLPENSGGGGVSRKIVDPEERKKLKELMGSMEIPASISLIIRTAGLGRTKREIQRDMSYLMRLWKMIEEKTKLVKAPILLHEEGDIIIRTIRDLYTSDMAEILIEGNEAYRRGKDFMRLLMPRFLKVVQPYRERQPIFARYGVEDQIESMHDRVIQLKGGGYLVVDITEALVSIDINSGRSTREKSVENTAFKTNMQAVDEIARQLRLRDLGGLIVIDFIDMEDKKHNLDVEKRLKDAIKMDRAKIQMGKISQFGLLELSRQRLKPAFSESSRQICPRCSGLGTVRSVESSAIRLMRIIEETASTGRYSRLTFRTSPDVVSFLLNQKRTQLTRMEEANLVKISVLGDPEIVSPQFRKEVVERPKGEELPPPPEPPRLPPPPEDDEEPDIDPDGFDPELDDEEMPVVASAAGAANPEQEGAPTRSRRRRRRRRRGSAGTGEIRENGSAATSDAESAAPAAEAPPRTSHPRPTRAPAPVAVSTGVPGLYILPPPTEAPTGDATPSVEATEGSDEGTAENGEPEESASGETAARPRRRRRRRRTPTRAAGTDQPSLFSEEGGSEEGGEREEAPPVREEVPAVREEASPVREEAPPVREETE
ncbi:MAG: ribonuclease E/G [Magnetococcales bacterium]|nr:ribonuclease E/G [Magnetococcales bacterium]